MSRNNIASWIEKYEPFLFYALVVLNLSLVFKFGNFPTIDGPSHLYNARIINELWFNNNEMLRDYFTFNPTPEPNWTGHFLLALLMQIFNASTSEKILLGAYVLILPISYRNLMSKIAAEKVLLSYFIFPLTFTMLFFFGFYNFSIGLALLFVSLNYVVRNYHHINSPGKTMMFFLLQLACYFSHIIIFSLLWLCIFLWLSTEIFSKINHQNSLKVILKKQEKSFNFVLISSVLPFILVLCYFVTHPMASKGATYVEFNILMEWLITMRSKIMFVTEKEVIYTSWLFILFFAFLGMALNGRFNQRIAMPHFRSWNSIGELLKLYLFKNDMWFVIAVIMLILYFVLPDANKNGSMISIRFSLLFYLFMILWMASGNFSKKMQWILILCIVFIQFKLHQYYSDTLKTLNSKIKDCKSMQALIKPNSVVLPIDFSKDWLAVHHANIIGADKPLVILQNYECQVGYFPLLWNESKIPQITLGYLKNNYLTGMFWKTNNTSLYHKESDYVIIIGEEIPAADSSQIKIKQALIDCYTLVRKTPTCLLYKNKKLKFND